MNCPECESALVYEEDIEGRFIYPIREDGLIDFRQREFNGDSLGHKIRCTNFDCGYVMPLDEMMEIFLRSVGEEPYISGNL